MPTRHIVFAVLFGVVIGAGMNYMLGGQLWIHMAVATAAALAAAYATQRGKTGGER